MQQFKKELDEKLGTLNWIPKIFTSVTDKKRIFQAIEMAVQVYENRIRKVTTSAGKTSGHTEQRSRL